MAWAMWRREEGRKEQGGREGGRREGGRWRWRGRCAGPGATGWESGDERMVEEVTGGLCWHFGIGVCALQVGWRVEWVLLCRLCTSGG